MEPETDNISVRVTLLFSNQKYFKYMIGDIHFQIENNANFNYLIKYNKS